VKIGEKMTTEFLDEKKRGLAALFLMQNEKGID